MVGLWQRQCSHSGFFLTGRGQQSSEIGLVRNTLATWAEQGVMKPWSWCVRFKGGRRHVNESWHLSWKNLEPAQKPQPEVFISAAVQTASSHSKQPLPVMQRKRLLPQPPPLLCPLSSTTKVRGELIQLLDSATELGPLSELSSVLVIYCLIKLISCSALKVRLSRHCLIKLISCPVSRLRLSWHSQHRSWRNEQGTSGWGVEALCRCAHVSPSLPSDQRESLSPAHRDLGLGCALVGTLRTFSHIPDGRRGWGGVGQAGSEPSSPGTHLRSPFHLGPGWTSCSRLP